MTDQEINEAVAVKLGWTIDQTGAYKPGDDPQAYDPPDYCHDIKAAWEVVEHICRLKPESHHWELKLLVTGNSWACEMLGGHIVYADTAPMAICLAFLKLE